MSSTGGEKGSFNNERGKNNDFESNNGIRSQSMVSKLETQLSNTNANTQASSSIRSCSTERQTTQIKFIKSFNYCARPDNGGTVGRKTTVKTNFYEIDFDYTKGAYHYDVDIIFIFIDKKGQRKEAHAKKALKNTIIEKAFQNYNLGFYAYDGEKNLYTVDKIDLVKAKDRFEITLNDDDGDEKNYLVKMNLVSTIYLKSMKDYIDKKISEIPKTAINLLNLVIRQNKLKTHKLVKNSIFNLNGTKEDLGEGLFYVIGQYLSIKPCQKGWLQNIDMKTGIFYKPLPLIDLINEIIPNLQICKFANGLTEENKINIQKMLKGLMIQTNHTDRKYHFIGFSDQSAREEKFKINEGTEHQSETTVAEYFKQKYKPLQYDYLPCIKVNNPNMEPICLPIEVCQLAPEQKFSKLLNSYQQRKITRGTVLFPNKRAEIITELMKNNLQDTNYLNNFGVKYSNHKGMINVNARVLDSPKVFYQQNKTPRIDNGKWTMDNHETPRIDTGKWRMANYLKLYNTTTKLENWFLIWIAKNKLKKNELEHYREKLIKGIIQTSNNAGLTIFEPIFKYCPEKTISEIFGLIRGTTTIKPQLVMFVFEETDERDEIKKIAETDKKYGLMTQCVKLSSLIKQNDFNIRPENVSEDRNFCNYLTNLLLKINVKIGGTNNLVDFPKLNNIESNMSQEVVMFFGADVTHHIGDDLSIAAVVASLDLNFTCYGVRLSEQKHEKDNRKSQEIIIDLAEMAYLLLKSFNEKNEVLPQRIIFYRDGVDEGQFKKVLDFELKALKDACNKIKKDYSPLITFIIVQKRHSIRFFPLEKNDMKGNSQNIPAGTVVDTGITTIDQFDFFLCSHETIQGTAQPTHYWVIYDENSFSSDEIQNLTFMLCHLYVRSTKSVSIPAPVYYSHHAAYRGRSYKQLDTDDDPDLDDEIRSKLIQIHPSLEETMFFT